ncbi:AAA family ATPase [Actinomycetospora chlora]|uniref:AAA family ATPase n=1 Tax=Actinomycetospora chlora TaxID=663608 RepID=A0ABP9BYX3_9PSEU
MDGTLLERAGELAALDAALERAAGGAGSVVLVAGEAGIGKTSLVRAFLRAVGDRARVLQGACDDLVTPRTLGPLRDAARTTDGPLPRALASGDRDAVLAAVRAELGDGRRPTVLAVEDVHWADGATLDVLRYLGRRIDALPAVLVLSYRDGEVGDELQRLLGALGGASVHRLRPARLSRAVVARWAGGTNVTSAELYRLTGGNPFYVSEVLAGDGADLAHVPPTVVDAVLARVHRLPAEAAGALEQLAVVPAAVDLALARELLGDLAVLGPAEAAGIVEVSAQVVGFRHELARRAVECALPATTRMARHARVLAALAARPDADPARLVHHAVAAGDDAAVVAHGPEAARQAGRAGALAQEIALYEHVLSRRHLVPDADRAAMLTACASAHFTRNQLALALVAGEAAVRLREQLGDPVALGEARVPLGPTLWGLARPAEAMAAADRAVADLEQGGPGPSLAFALSYRGLLLSTLDRYTEALAVAEVALPMARAVGVPALEALALMLRGRTRVLLDDPEGDADMTRARELAVAAGHHVFAMHGFVLTVQDLWEVGRCAEAVAVAEEGIAYVEERDLDLYREHLEAHLLRWRAVRGEWDAAEAGLRALAGHRDGGESAATRYTLPGLARLLVRRGADDAADVVAWALDYGHRADSRYELVPALLAEVEQAWLAGDTARARAALDRLGARLRGPGPARQRAELVRWRRRLGDDVTPFPGCPEPLAAGIRGEHRAAAAGWRDLGAPYEQALELLEGGVDDVLEALALLDGLGARPAAARARRRLRELGVRSVPRGPGRARTPRASPSASS